jgi:hypothetical protein
MDDTVLAVINDGGALAMLGLVLWMVNKHFARMLDNHQEDRSVWLSAIREITAKLGLIEKDINDIDEDVQIIKITLEEKL